MKFLCSLLVPPFFIFPRTRIEIPRPNGKRQNETKNKIIFAIERIKNDNCNGKRKAAQNRTMKRKEKTEKKENCREP